MAKISISDISIVQEGFLYFVISSPLLKLYQLAGQLNKELQLDLRLRNDLPIFIKDELLELHSYYSFKDIEQTYHLIHHTLPNPIFKQYATYEYLFLVEFNLGIDPRQEASLRTSYHQNLVSLPNVFSCLDINPSVLKEYPSFVMDMAQYSTDCLVEETQANPRRRRKGYNPLKES